MDAFTPIPSPNRLIQGYKKDEINNRRVIIQTEVPHDIPLDEDESLFFSDNDELDEEESKLHHAPMTKI